MSTKKGPVRKKQTVKVELSHEDLNDLILTLILHRNSRMEAMSKFPAPSSGELRAFSRHQDRLGALCDRLKEERALSFEL